MPSNDLSVYHASVYAKRLYQPYDIFYFQTFLLHGFDRCYILYSRRGIFEKQLKESKKIKLKYNTFAAEEHKFSEMIILKENRYKTVMISFLIKVCLKIAEINPYIYICVYISPIARYCK